jgi:hypothetical protein
MKDNFFTKLLRSKSGVSTRRFIALLIVPSYIIGIFVGIFSREFNFYLTAMISGGVIIFMTYYSLSWVDVKNIVGSIKLKENSGWGWGSSDNNISNIDISADELKIDKNEQL